MASKHAGATLGVLVALCAFGLFFGLKAISEPFTETSFVEEEPPACETRQIDTDTVIAADEVTVSVYNASGRDGAASKTLQGLIERGFGAGESGNVDASVKYVQVWADDKDNPAAQLVAAQFGPKTLIVTDKELPGVGIVVVVGPRLGAFDDDAPTEMRATKPATICSPPIL